MRGLRFMDKELVAEWFRFAGKAIKYALDVRDFEAITKIRTELER